MCRIAGYLGPPISLQAFMLRPEHSLYRQSWDARELRTATVNADGYGVAWQADDGTPAVYRSVMPAWADPNLEHLAHSLHSRLWLGNVRSATEGLATHVVNTQPFVDEARLFTHNGFIQDFAATARRGLRALLPEALEQSIVGTTDSEYLFALACRPAAGPLAALQSLYRAVADTLKRSDTPALLNIVLSDGDTLAAMRAALNAPAPSLYFHRAHPGLRDGAVVASEACDHDTGWQAVPADHCLLLTPDNARLEAL